MTVTLSCSSCKNDVEVVDVLNKLTTGTVQCKKCNTIYGVGYDEYYNEDSGDELNVFYLVSIN